jgi:hypothetical protein
MLSERGKARKRAEWRAHKRLADRYPHLYARLLNEELRLQGLEDTAGWRERRDRR